MKILIAIIALGCSVCAAADTIELKVNGLVCGFCAQGIEKTLRRQPATADVVVSLEHRLVAVETRPGQTLTDEALAAALKNAGYDVVSIERTTRSLADIRRSLKAGESR